MVGSQLQIPDSGDFDAVNVDTKAWSARGQLINLISTIHRRPHRRSQTLGFRKNFLHARRGQNDVESGVE
jgi:hypothetical protein